MTSRLSALIAASVVLGWVGSLPSAAARGGVTIPDPPWNAEHFNALPPEIKKAITPFCKATPALGHYFALYAANSRFMNLHFEHFHCGGAPTLCRAKGCLHQVYVLTNGKYRLQRSFYRADPD